MLPGGDEPVNSKMLPVSSRFGRSTGCRRVVAPEDRLSGPKLRGIEAWAGPARAEDAAAERRAAREAAFQGTILNP